MAAPYALPYSAPRQTVTLRLPINQPAPEVPPTELQRFYNRDVWAARQRAVLMKSTRYMKPILEIAIVVFLVLATFALPIILYYVLTSALPKDERVIFDERGREFILDNRFYKARMISGAIALAVLLLGWIPLFAWKHQGKRQINLMLKKFSAEDAAMSGTVGGTPTWWVGMPGIGSRAIRLNISYPMSLPPTVFQPGAGLPPYVVNPPSDPRTAMFYSQGYQAYPGTGPVHLSPTSSRNSVPLYNEKDEKVPDYSSPDGYIPHEKSPRSSQFVDIKV